MSTLDNPWLTPRIFGKTHVGTVREENEDAVIWWTDQNHQVSFAALADGMGGHQGGKIASQIVLNTIQSELQASLDHISLPENGDSDVLPNLMGKVMETANKAVRSSRTQSPEYSKMGTTLVFIAIWKNQIVLLHAGDSRCYLITGYPQRPSNELIQLTRDDSVVQQMLDEAVITADDIPNIPYRNALTNAMGIQSPLKYTLCKKQVSEGDQVLLCSDGFHNAVLPEDIPALLAAKCSVKEKAEHLIQCSLDSETDDNTSVILIEMQKSN